MARSRLALKTVLHGGFALLFTTAWAQPAHAAEKIVYQSSSLCVKGEARLFRAVSGGLIGYVGDGYTHALNPGCTTGVTRSGALKVDVYRWNGSAWTVCRTSGWKYGTTGQSTGQFAGPYGPSATVHYGNAAGNGPACGAGYYGTLSNVYAADAGEWRGGSVWSGYQHVPATHLRGETKPAAPSLPAPASESVPPPAGAPDAPQG
ncbi:hypothetical protein PS9374_05627 [Planomonospora sphaerica]|uniref:Secreted protein n=1 Tax=Planomonospora sphaerica TaxID=161355 RepID=A0A161LLX8_9ACTN|nr:hypothetical protein [Planomonospora sphaerica]GAT69947.1 hypothetical protein PS9374_05627 [Planomonospora sphaerica]